MTRKIHDTGTGFKRYLETQEWTDLVQAGRRRIYERADFILRQGEAHDTVHLLTEGRAKVDYTEPGGGEVLLSVRGPGDLLGEMARAIGRRMASVRAMEQCVTYELTADTFGALMRRRGWKDEFEKYAMSKLAESAPQQWCAARMRAKARLAQLLMSVVDVAGRRCCGPSRITSAMT